MTNKIMPTAEWLATLPQAQHDRYTYPTAVYKGVDNNIEVTCPTHGPFWQNAYIHKHKGAGCPKCNDSQRGASQRDTKESFVAKTENVPEIAGKYDYSDVVYVNQSTLVTVICPKHGPFRVSPGNHLSGKGCRKCFDERRYLIQLSNTPEFIAKAKAKVPDEVGYHKAVYVGAKVKLELVCPKHGSFWITPDRHLQGGGCPECNTSGYKAHKPGFLYVLGTKNSEIVKVGITNRKPEARAKEVSKSSKKLFYVLGYIRCEYGAEARAREIAAHAWLHDNGVPVEEVFDGSTECFHKVNVADLISHLLDLPTTESE